MLSIFTGLGKSTLIMGVVILVLIVGWWGHVKILKSDVESAKAETETAKAESTRLEGELAKANSVISNKNFEIDRLKMDKTSLEVQAGSISEQLATSQENLTKCIKDSSFLTEWCKKPRNVTVVDKTKCEVVDDESYNYYTEYLNGMFDQFDNRLFNGKKTNSN